MCLRIVPFAVRRAWVGGVLAIVLASGPATTFGQAGARQSIQRQLNRARDGEAQPKSDPNTPPAEDDDFKKIDKAKSVEELIDLAKTFVISQKLEAAEKAVEKIVARDPKLLEDDQRQSPKSWNDFWFAHRAKLREKKLGPRDAAGRVKLALWLDAAGLMSPARAMLMAAISIDKNEPTAKELADKWNIYAGGPVHFDLTLGFQEPLVIEKLDDEGQSISPRTKGHVYLIIPVACNTAGQRLMINKGDIKATNEEGKLCAPVGMVVVEATDASGGATGTEIALEGRGSPPTLKRQAGNEPVWEQAMVLAGDRDKPQDIEWKNLIHPIIPRTPGQRNQPPPPPPSGPAKTTRASTGYLAFIFDIVDSTKSVSCAYKGEPAVQFDLAFLKALSQPVDKLEPAERGKLVATLSAQATNPAPAVAAAALRKLNELRLTGDKDSGLDGGPILKASDDKQKLETLLVAGLAHESPQVRRMAFDLLSKNGSAGLDALVANSEPAGLVSNLVSELRAYLEEVQAAQTAATEGAAAPAPAPTGEATTLAKWPIGEGVPGLLAGCLSSKQEESAEQALELCLAHPCVQTVGTLAHAKGKTMSTLLARVEKLTDAKVKTAILGALLGNTDKAQLAAVLAAFKGTVLHIDREDDPLLALALSDQPVSIQVPLLNLLASAQFSAQGISEKLKKLVEKYSAVDAKPDPKLQAAIRELAAGQMSRYYVAPIKRDRQSNAAGSRQAETSFAGLLAAIAASPATSPAEAREAATKLVSLGQARALHEQLQRFQGDAREARVRDLIDTLGRDKQLWAHEALPIFLGLQLASTDTKTRQKALAAMTAMQSGTDIQQRWRVNLALKQGLEAKQLVTLSLDSNESVSRAAMTLLRGLSAMTAAEAAEFAGVTDESGRQGRLSTLEQDRSSKPLGAFACMVYLDVRSDANLGGAVVDRDSIPLEAVKLTVQRAASGEVRVFAGNAQIGPPLQKQEGQSFASPGSMAIDVAALVRAALETDAAKQEGLAGKINPATLRAARVCELKYEQLGTWSGEVNYSDALEPPTKEHPLTVAGAKIVLEPTVP